MPNLLFDSLDSIERRIRDRRDDIAYLALYEVVDRSHNDSLGRVDFNATDLAPWLADAEIERADPFPEAGTLEDLATASDQPDETLSLADAACRWLREMVAANMHGRAHVKFRLFVWRPKGDSILFSARFGCIDPHFDADVPVESIIQPANPLAPTVDAANVVPSVLETRPEARVWGARGEGYTHLIGLLQKSYAHLAALQNTTITNQNSQILRLQKVLEELMGDVVKLRVGLAENEQVQREDSGASRVREELGRQFIAEVGTFGRVLAAAKFGMPAEMVELAEVVQASPELMDAMKAPDVRRMLRDEKTRKELAELLLMAARSAPTANTAPLPEATAGAA